MELPVGISDFRKLVKYRSPLTGEHYLFVDKTNFINEIVGDGSEVIVITRPRRFGKTINMSMLQYFYAPEVDGQSTKGLFDGLKISKESAAMKVQGAHPVLFISFKDATGTDIESAMASISVVIQEAFEQHRYLLKSDKLAKDQKDLIKYYLGLSGAFSASDMQKSLKSLTGYIEKHFGKKVMLLVDEYDTPIERAYSGGYYAGVIDAFRSMFGALLKGNNAIVKAVLTGIIRVSNESLFSAISHVSIYSVLNDEYSSHFGFLEDDVKDLLKNNKEVNLTGVRQWYNGYKFGSSTVYNPWSIINYMRRNFELKAYWVNTSQNVLAKELLLQASPIIKQKIEALISGNTVEAFVNEHVVFADLDRNESALWSILIASGYLMSVKSTSDGDFYRCNLQIPNKEVLRFYLSTVRTWISSSGDITWFEEFVAALISGEAGAIESKIQDVIDNTMSYHDGAKNIYEAFFHGLMLGVVAGLKDEYTIKSNRESGLGRYDLALFPKDKTRAGVIMEFKAEDVKDTQVEKLALSALKQLAAQDYVRELKDAGVKTIIALGVGFTKNKMRVLEQKTKQGVKKVQSTRKKAAARSTTKKTKVTSKAKTKKTAKLAKATKTRIKTKKSSNKTKRAKK